MKSILTFLFITSFCFLLRSQVQIGGDIDGEASGDSFGTAVAISANGMRVVIGANENDDNGSNAGHVRVYEDNGGNWVQLGNDIDGEAAGDYSGKPVAMSPDGNLVAIGAPFNDGTGTWAGHVRVFSYNGIDWVQLGHDINGDEAGDLFGSSVSFSADGSLLAIGAPGAQAIGDFIGYARVYSYEGSEWSPLGNDIHSSVAGEALGYSVSLSANGSRLVVGVPGNDNVAFGAGLVQVYEYSGGVWTTLGESIYGDGSQDEMGHAVSISPDGSCLAVSAYKNDNEGEDVGLTRVFRYSDFEWVQMGGDIYGEAPNDWSGSSLALSDDGTRLAIGAVLNDGSATNAGHTRLYGFIGESWVQLGSDIDGEAAGDFSAWAISLSADGTRLVVGAYGNDDAGTDAGHARVFDFSNNTYNISISACDSYISPSGNYTWTTSGSYLDIITNPTGEDSLIVIDLNIITIDTSVLQSEMTLLAMNAGATYQWLDCNNGFSSLAGETNQSFSTTNSGEYAVEISQNGCIDTSACYTIETVGIAIMEDRSSIIFYPNPTTGSLTIIGAASEKKTIRIINSSGKIIRELISAEQDIDLSDLPAGLYNIAIYTKIGSIVQRIIKE